jgi:hypothetical protein
VEKVDHRVDHEDTGDGAPVTVARAMRSSRMR